MAQETFYFPHDYNPLTDPKLQAMVSVYGGSGYGVYWRVVEMLHANDEHKLPLEAYLYMAIGKEMSVSLDSVKEIVESSIETFKLFQSDGECFWSERVFRNIEKRIEIAEQRSKAGKASAKARKKLKELADKHPDLDVTDVERSLTDVEQPSTKERKEKERKEN